MSLDRFLVFYIAVLVTALFVIRLLYVIGAL